MGCSCGKKRRYSPTGTTPAGSGGGLTQAAQPSTTPKPPTTTSTASKEARLTQAAQRV